MRVVLQFGDTWFVELEPGATVVGRDPACGVQLHDDAVSRRHARFHWDGSARVTVQDLGSTNGTRLNGNHLDETRELVDGDVLLMGHSLCTVRLLSEEVGAPAGTRRNRPPSIQPHAPVRETLATCSTCLQPLPGDGSECPTCARERRQADRRRDQRIRTRVSVRFVSGQGSFSTTVHDLSLGGMFLLCDRPAEGPCSITLLPDDTGPMVIKGQVRHVILRPTTDGHPAGIGVKFTEMERRAWRWIQGVVARHEEPWVYGDTSS